MEALQHLLYVVKFPTWLDYPLLNVLLEPSFVSVNPWLHLRLAMAYDVLELLLALGYKSHFKLFKITCRSFPHPQNVVSILRCHLGIKYNQMVFQLLDPDYQLLQLAEIAGTLQK